MQVDVVASDNQTKVVKVNRVAASVLALVGALIGLAPGIVHLGRPFVSLYFAAGALLLAIIYCVRKRSAERDTVRATNSPLMSEFLLAGLGAVFPFAFLSFVWLILYPVLYWLLRAVQALTGWPVNAGGITFYVTASLVSLIAIVLLLNAFERIISQLYPNAAGVDSAFRTAVTARRKRLFVMLSVVALILLVLPTIAVFLFAGAPPPWFYIYLNLCLIILSAGPFNAQSATATTSPEAAIAVGKLLEAVGYQVTVYPRLGDEEVDPLLVYLDIIAYSPGRALAIKLRTPKSSTEPVDWSAASGLTMCVRSLNNYLPRLELEASELEPCLVLIGVSADQSLLDYCKDEPIQLIAIENETALHQVLSTGNQDEMKSIASKYFGFAVEGPDSFSSPKALVVPEGAH